MKKTPQPPVGTHIEQTEIYVNSPITEYFLFLKDVETAIYSEPVVRDYPI
jgi:hypothetical protein